MQAAHKALYVLGSRAHQERQLARAEELLRASIEAVALAGQSFVLVQALEALAAVFSAQRRPRCAAVLLGTAMPRATRPASTCDPSRHPTRSCTAPSCGNWAPRPSTPPTARGRD